MSRICKQELPDTEDVALTRMQEIYDVSAREFARWVARQIVLKRMRPIDPQIATTIMFEMFFGGLISRDKCIRQWSSTDERRHYMEECLRVFVDGTSAGPSPLLAQE